MKQMVTVSLLQPQGFRANKKSEVIRYPMGMVEMPLEHAEAMGLRRRIMGVSKSAADGTTSLAPLPFGGAFDDKLVSILQAAGYTTLEELGKLSQDDLMALDGVGPAAFERITRAVQGA